MVTAHPEVDTVFVAGLSGGRGVIPQPGQGKFEAAVQGYIDAWKALLATVRHIVVLNDTPKMRSDTANCIEHAMATHRRADLA